MRHRNVPLLLALAGTCFAAGSALAADDLPISRVTLYRSGVAAFERSGSVDGAATLGVVAEAGKVNDLLKSLVVLDPDGNGAPIVRYAAEDPLSRRLSNLRLSASNVSGIASLLRQLVGETVTIEVSGERLTGTVTGTANRQVSDGEGMDPITRPFVTLTTPTGIRSIDTWGIRSVNIEDPDLRADLEQSFSLLQEARSQEGRAVDISLAGGPERPVSVFYIQEAPVWKTSYRLVVPEDGSDPIMQAWAIVENTSDEDWDGVELSLAAGHPIGFTMDLRSPLYKPRPMLPVPIAGAETPQSIASTRGDVGRFIANADELRAMPREGMRMRLEEADSAFNYADMASNPLLAQQVASGIAAQQTAIAVEAGESFFFTAEGAFDVRAGASVMLPIVSAPVPGERVSFFQAQAGRTAPVKAIELANNSDMPFPAGPVSVYDEGRYAGDGQITSLAPGRDAMVAYARDQELFVRESANSATTSQVRRVRIVDGTMISTLSERFVREYEIENSDNEDRELVIQEQPIGGWELETDADKAADGTLRFRVDVKADSEASFEVVRTRVRDTRIAVVSADLGTLLSLERQRRVSSKVVDAVREAGRLNAEINRLESELNRLRQLRTTLERDQSRYRDNIRATQRGTELHERYLRNLGTSEDEIIRTDESIEQTQRALVNARRALDDYVRDLDVS
ncbi:MAG: hypothetical protein AAGB51_04275 [Planctomycetota bacterium]